MIDSSDNICERDISESLLDNKGIIGSVIVLKK